jgi:hypothetical protein
LANHVFSAGMSFNTIRPILSGILGAIIVGWLFTKWAKWVPATVGGKGREQLLKEHKGTLRVANAFSLSGLCVGLLCYWSDWLGDHDWRGAGLGAGLTALLPILCMVVANAARGPLAIKECMVPYAIAQKTPIALLFTLMALLILGGVLSAVSLFL